MSNLIPKCKATLEQIRSVEKIVGYLSEEIVQRGLHLDDQSPPHFHLYSAWLQHQAERYRNEILICSDMDETTSVADSGIGFAVQVPEDIAEFPDIRLALKIASEVQNIFAREKDALAIMMEDELLSRTYEEGLLTDGVNDKVLFLAQLLSHQNSSMKILEIGAGTGGTTLPVLRGLTAVDGKKMYQSYTFTDISAGFFEKAKQKLHTWEDVKYSVLNIENDPAEQGLSEKYDLVVAANVLHATSDMNNTMRNVRSLLKDDGVLLMVELSGDLSAPGFLMGLLPGWWLRSQQPTRSGPGLDTQEWSELLLATGFSSPDLIPNIRQDATEDAAYTSVMMARAVPQTPLSNGLISDLCVHLTTRDISSPMYGSLVHNLTEKGVYVKSSALSAVCDQATTDKWLVILDAENDTMLSSLQPGEMERLKMSLSKPAQILWITFKAQLQPDNPLGGLVAGFARSLRSENDQLRLFTLDFSSSNSKLIAETVYSLIERLQHSRKAGAPLEFQFAEKDGQLYTCRIEVDTQLESAYNCARPVQVPIFDLARKPYVLSIRDPGQLNTLVFVEEDQPKDELPSDDLVIEVKTVGLSKQDGLVSQGLKAGREFGGECAGVVRRCDITSKFKPGDRVLALGNGTFRTIYQTPSICCKRIPDWLSFEQAAAMPISFVTAWYSLVEVAGILKDERVLIVNGASDVGIAAIQVAKLYMGNVFTIVINAEEKAIVEGYGVSPSKIFVIENLETNRRTEFPKSDMFDIVLNSEPYQCRSLSRALAFRGRYLEIRRGKTNDIAKECAPQPNTTMAIIDVEQLLQENKPYVGRILDRVMEHVERKELHPVSSIICNGVDKVEETFSSILNDHRKHVATIYEEDQVTHVKVQRNRLTFHKEGTYLIVGGLGGLGQSIAIWMASRGAGHLVLMTRSAFRADKAGNLIRHLRAYGCECSIRVGDVSEPEDVSRAISAAKYPIRGVVQAALALSDKTFQTMTLTDFNTVLDPKVKGTLNLHHALQDEDLNFFVILGSGCGIVGNPGQSNYSAASTFLDSFARYRRSLGLPACTIDLGSVEDIGYVSENPKIAANLSAVGIHPLTERDFLDIMEAAILAEPVGEDIRCFDPYADGQIIRAFSTNIKQNSRWAGDSKFTRLFAREENNSKSAGSGTGTPASADGNRDAELHAALNSIASDPATLNSSALHGLVSKALARKLASVLSISPNEISLSQSPARYGMDSLIAIELRSWARAVLGVELQVMELLNVDSIGEVVEKVVERVKLARQAAK